jgi:hypothetical protein
MALVHRLSSGGRERKENYKKDLKSNQNKICQPTKREANIQKKIVHKLTVFKKGLQTQKLDVLSGKELINWIH